MVVLPMSKVGTCSRWPDVCAEGREAMGHPALLALLAAELPGRGKEEPPDPPARPF